MPDNERSAREKKFREAFHNLNMLKKFKFPAERNAQPGQFKQAMGKYWYPGVEEDFNAGKVSTFKDMKTVFDDYNIVYGATPEAKAEKKEASKKTNIERQREVQRKKQLEKPEEDFLTGREAYNEMVQKYTPQQLEFMESILPLVRPQLEEAIKGIGQKTELDKIIEGLAGPAAAQLQQPGSMFPSYETPDLGMVLGQLAAPYAGKAIEQFGPQLLQKAGNLYEQYAPQVQQLPGQLYQQGQSALQRLTSLLNR